MPISPLLNNTVLAARTIMFSELEKLLTAASEPKTSVEEYKRLVVEENILGKKTMRTRTDSFGYLKRLYRLDSKDSLFTAFRILWESSVSCRKLLAAQFAYLDDLYFRSSAPFFLKMAMGNLVTTEVVNDWLEPRFPAFTKVTRWSVAKNLNSSWFQAGFFEGRPPRRRVQVKAEPENAVFAVYSAYLNGKRGMYLFENEWTALLEQNSSEIVYLAETAARSGLMVLHRLGDVVEVKFPRFESERERVTE